MSAPRGTAAVEEHSPTTEPEEEGPLSTNCVLEEEAAGRAKPPRPGAPTGAADSVKLLERGVDEKGSIVEPQTPRILQ